MCMKNPAAQARAPWKACREILMVRQDMLYNYNTYHVYPMSYRQPACRKGSYSDLAEVTGIVRYPVMAEDRMRSR